MRAFAIRASALLLCLLTAPHLPAQKTWVDKEHGFSVKPIPKWEGFPVEPTERYTVAKWASPRDERDFPCRMLVHVFERKPPKKADASPAEGEKPAGTSGYDLPDNPFGEKRSFKSWARFRRSGLKLDKGKKIKIKAPKGLAVTARLYEGLRDSGYTLGGRPLGNFYSMILVVTTDTREYAVEMFCGEVSKKKYRPLFKKTARSFRLLETAADASETDSEEGLSPREEARRRARANSKVGGWWFEESKHYIIVTNVPKRKAGRIKALRDQLEIMRGIYERDFPPVKPIEAVSIVRVCKDRDDYHTYGGPGGSAGYWYAAARELVLYISGEKAFALTVLNHEGFHQYIYYATGGNPPHIWYNEGYADYYGGVRLAGKKPIFKPLKWRIDTIKGAIRAGKHVPLEKMLHYTQAQYYSNSDLCYAQGWSMAWFLEKGLPKKHPWRKISKTYFETLCRTRSRQKAYEAAFGDVDLAAFEKAWKEFTVKGVKAPFPKASGKKAGVKAESR